MSKVACCLGAAGLAVLLCGLLVLAEVYTAYWEGQRWRWYRPKDKKE